MKKLPFGYIYLKWILYVKEVFHSIPDKSMTNNQTHVVELWISKNSSASQCSCDLETLLPFSVFIQGELVSNKMHRF